MSGVWAPTPAQNSFMPPPVPVDSMMGEANCVSRAKASETALANAKQALQDHPELAGMVALYGYNGPACLEALRELDRLNTIKLIAFDNHEATLIGVSEGFIEGTVVQDPYLYGYESIETLCKLCRGRPASIPVPGAGSIALPCAVVDKENLQEYQENLRRRVETSAP